MSLVLAALVGGVWARASASAAAGESPAATKPASGPTAPAASAPAGAKEGGLPVRRDTTALPTLPGGETGGVLGRMLAYVLVIVVLGVVAVLVMRRYFPRGAARPGGGLRIAETVYLAPRKQILVLEAEGRRFLLASCRESLTLLTELTGPFSDLYAARSDAQDEAAEGGQADGPAEAGEAGR